MTDADRQPANHSGSPIPNAIPNLGAAERDAVVTAVETGMLAIGPAIGELESLLAARHGGTGQDRVHAVAVSSGTAALHLALLAAGVGPNDLVIVPEATFIATVNAVVYCGATPLLADVDPRTGLLDVPGLAEYLDNACEVRAGIPVLTTTGQRIAALVPVDLFGHPVDLDAASALAASYAIPLVEDAAEALGATYRDTAVGTPRDLAILSFNGNKVITGGAGGLVLARDPAVADRCRYLANQARDDGLYFNHASIGFNYRLPNLNAAVVVAQLGRLDQFVTRKRAIAAAYAAACNNVPGVALTADASWARSSCWMSVLRLSPDEYPAGAAPVIADLVARGVGARPTWTPLGDLPPHAAAPRIGGAAAREFFHTTLCLPCSTGITDAEIARVIENLVAILPSHAG